MIKNLSALADRLKGIKVGDKDLTIDMLKDIWGQQEEIELTVPAVNVLDNTQLESLKTTVREEQKTISYGEGKTAGIEMTVKSLKKKAGIETEGKDPDKFYDELIGKIEKEKGVEPNKKINELTESIKNLQTQIETKDGEINTLKTEKAGIEKKFRVNEYLTGIMPKNLAGINQKQFSVLFNAEGYNIDFTETGEPFVTQNGKALKDQMEKYQNPEAVLTEFATKNKWIDLGGRGDGDRGGSAPGEFKTMDDVMEHCFKNNINPDSLEGRRLQDEFEAKKSA